ncbi:hypothetical protein PV708_02775 [Streptomyces sp. ME02-6977A]|uniref:hypothetical protein n=1 Tax=Streptomyces sp. ME02-6977A TaxID=3028671 RepID=UPI0029AC5F8E|nr:hypothetical protein [Streptomyces sp. ME02-6977A]MDX3405161.1 hypothetical protein [Streptomyces sp. ME02-6977A]
MPNTYYPYDNGTVGPTGPEGPQGPTGPAGANGVVQSVNGQSVEAVVLDASDVGALPDNANAQLDATYLSISRPAGNYRALRWMTDGTSRWEAQVDDTPEAGSNTGSNFRLSSRNDDGSFNKTAVYASRASGQVSFGTTVQHGSATATSAGAVGLRDISTDPATVSGGVFLYSKGGVPYFKNADGTSFQIQPLSYPVSSVNGETGHVTLGASDVGALPTTGGVLTGALRVTGDAGSYRTYSLGTGNAESGTHRWLIQADNAAESEAGDGSNLVITARNNAGSFQKHVLYAKRDTGQTSFGVTIPLGEAQVTSNSAVGIRDQAADPATAAGGIQLYSKGGLPYIKQGDGTIFKVGSGGGTGGGAVDSVNGKTGIVTLTADDVNALPEAGGTLTGPVTITPASGNGLTVYGSTDAATYFRVTAEGHPYSNSLRPTFYNLGVGDTGTSFGGGKFVLGIKNANVVPTENPTNGVIAYAQGDKLKVLHPDGKIVTVGEQAVTSVNNQTGAVVVDLDDLGGLPYNEKAAANGVASLDSAKRVPVAQLPSFAKPSDFDPTDLGLKAWSSDPAMCSVADVYPTSGQGRVTAVKINEAVSVSNIVWYFKGYAGGLKSGSWAGIYNSSGTLMRATGDLSTSTYEPQEQHSTGGGNSWSKLTSAVTLQPGIYYVAFRMVYTESPVNGPAMLAYDNQAACPSRLGFNNMWRWASLNTSASSAPSSISTGSFVGDPKRFWVGLA